MKLIIFAFLAAATVVVSASALRSRDTPADGSTGTLCSAIGTVTIQGITEPIPPISATCNAGLSCSATQAVTDIPGLGELLDTVAALLDLLASLPIIGELPVIPALLNLLAGLINIGVGLGSLNELFDPLLASLGTANVTAMTCA